MDNGLSLSIFVIEVDLKPVLAFDAKKNSDATIIFQDEGIRAKLRTVRYGGKLLYDDLAILRLRLAHPEERAIYYGKARSLETALRMVFLLEVDEIDEANTR
jgi:hypothetical protein